MFFRNGVQLCMKSGGQLCMKAKPMTKLRWTSHKPHKICQVQDTPVAGFQNLWCLLLPTMVFLCFCYTCPFKFLEVRLFKFCEASPSALCSSASASAAVCDS